MNKHTTSETVSLDISAITAQEVYQILSTAVAPRPIAFASTIDKEGRINLSPFSFFNVFSAQPPILIFSPVRRMRDNTSKDTLQNVHEVKEVVINIVDHGMVEQMSLTSTEYDKGVSEFGKSGLTPVASDKVRPPRVKESPVAFECEVDNIIALGEEGGAGSLVVSRVVKIHMSSKNLDDQGKLDTTKLDLVARLGANWYARVTPESLFEIPKPIRKKGIGVDQLPAHVFQTNILSGNDLGRLGNSENIPSEQSLANFRNLPEIEALIQLENPKEKIEGLHILAKSRLAEGDSDFALKALFAIRT